MNFFDAIVLAVTLLLAIKGFFNGFVKEIAGLVGIVGGLFLASKYNHQAGMYINDYIFNIPNKSAVDLVGFVAVFVGFWLFAVFIGFLFGKILKISALSGLDKMLGFIFAGAKFFLLVSVIVALLSQVALVREKMQEYVKDSFMYPITLKVGEAIMNLSSKDFENLGKNVKILKNKGD
ncbi:MAG: CvpA family protein [Epsilonproteobacteria bacterium]|nr:CvpA family protein [Campylobacterota bacterium]